MKNFCKDILNNRVLQVTFISWLIAQGLKILPEILKKKRINAKLFLRTGGMPSSHSATVTTLALCIGKEMGFSSVHFAFSCVFALITMFDAQTWRRSIGVQATLLNQMLEDFHKDKKINQKKLKELIGHTPIEVFVGLIIGILVFLFFY